MGLGRHGLRGAHARQGPRITKRAQCPHCHSLRCAAMLLACACACECALVHAPCSFSLSLSSPSFVGWGACARRQLSKHLCNVQIEPRGSCQQALPGGLQQPMETLDEEPGSFPSGARGLPFPPVCWARLRGTLFEPSQAWWRGACGAVLLLGGAGEGWRTRVPHRPTPWRPNPSRKRPPLLLRSGSKGGGGCVPGPWPHPPP